jgi:1,4-dihydroxy-2-naphthoate octaprenyltransferase
MALIGIGPMWMLLTWLSIPLAVRWARLVWTQPGRILNQALAGTGQMELVYGLLFAAGLIFARLV